MGFFRKLFGLKEKEIPVETIPKDIQQEPQQEVKSEWQPSEPVEVREFIDRPCVICGKIIGTDKRKKIQGKDFHRTCFKEEKRKARMAGQI